MNDSLFELVTTATRRYRDSLAERPVGAPLSREALLERLDLELPEDGHDPRATIEALIDGVDPGLIGSAGPRYFGYVIGGSTPVSVAADWLTAAWDQNAQSFGSSPAASVVEEIVARWVLEVLDLPADCGVGFVTGAQAANLAALVIARDTVLRRHGWEIEKGGLQGAPGIRVFCGACGHATVLSALRMIGLGNSNIRVVPADEQGRLEFEPLREQLASSSGPAIICAQAGNVNTGAFDPFEEIVALAEQHAAWLHVDGAFGLWARSSPMYRALTRGVAGADSWATDAHKWLNVPYDSGIVIVRDAVAHRRLKSASCAYAAHDDENVRHGAEWVLENSRRARGFVLYAALRSLGRLGVRRLVEDSCDRAQRFAQGLSRLAAVEVVNQVVLNQLVCRMRSAPGPDTGPSEFHQRVAARVQREGTCWIGATVWAGRPAWRISVSSAQTTSEDVDRSVANLAAAIAAETSGE